MWSAGSNPRSSFKYAKSLAPIVHFYSPIVVNALTVILPKPEPVCCSDNYYISPMAAAYNTLDCAGYHRSCCDLCFGFLPNLVITSPVYVRIVWRSVDASMFCALSITRNLETLRSSCNGTPRYFSQSSHQPLVWGHLARGGAWRIWHSRMVPAHLMLFLAVKW